MALSPAPLTLPAHASLFTGQIPPRHGVRLNSLHRLASDVPTLAERLSAAGYPGAAFVGAVVLASRFGLGRGFDVYDDEMGGRVSGLVGYAERSARDVVDAADAWLAQAPSRFFLWVHFYDPHAKYEPPPGFASAFSSRPYDGEVAFADAQLGRLLDSVRARFDDGRTLVAVTSDHGESLGAHGELTHSYTLYQATQRVPLVMAGPGLPRGRVVAQPVRLVDVAPTLLALAGAEALPATDGRDLRALIDGEPGEAPSAYMETLATQLDHGWSPLFGLRSADFTFIRAPRVELYDLAVDPGEAHNVAAERPALTARFDAELERRLAGSRASAGVALSEEARAQLESLGYVAEAGALPTEPLAANGRAEPGDVALPDPKDEIGLLSVLADATTAASEGRLDEALAHLEGAESAGTGLTALRASLAFGAGRLELAERDARDVLARQPGRSDLQTLLGRVLEAGGRCEEARSAFAAATALDPAAVSAHLGLGRCLEVLGRTDAAADAYTAARRVGPGVVEPTWRLALLALRDGRGEEADALLAELPPDAATPAGATLELAAAESRAGRVEVALRRIAAAETRHAGDARLPHARGALLLEAGRPEQALAAEEEALALAPDEAAVQNAIAWLLVQLRREPDRALALAQSAVTGSARAPEALDTLATVHAARGEAREALAVTDELLASAPAPLHAHARFVRARSLAALGRRGEARREVSRALEASGPESPLWRADAVALEAQLSGPDGPD